MKTIKIAPSLEEITLSADGTQLQTDFAGGITYTAPGMSVYKEDYLKESFQAAIAMAGKRWVLEEVLNKHFHLNGKIN